MAKCRYEVEEERYLAEPAYRVVRRNRNGQGWSVATYASQKVADAVASLLSAASKHEVE